MRLLRPLVLCLPFLFPYAYDLGSSDIPKEKHDYQSDVARMRKIVVNSLYSHKDVFLRELISNANDALEKLRLMALTDKSVWGGADTLNITIQVIKNENAGTGGRIIITDTGIGMTPEELALNLGTLAKSGTSEFLAKAESQDTVGNGHLIGAFGLGFYSSFLVADKVFVSSLPPKSLKVPNPIQHVFSSTAGDSSFEIFMDPRGNTLGRGTEITLVLKNDASEYLDTTRMADLVGKHSSYSSAFPIYLFTQRMEMSAEHGTETANSSAPASAKTSETEINDDEAIIEGASGLVDRENEGATSKMKSIVVNEWIQLNPQPPLWMRDHKNVTDEDYTLFYNAFFKDFSKPLAWNHFAGDLGSGVSFKAIIYVPSGLDDSYWQRPVALMPKDVRLLVKHVFVTSDLGDGGLPKWASWVKVVVDAEDLPLNVSRETLQSTHFLKQIKQLIVKRLIQLFTRIAKDDKGKFEELQAVYGSVLKLGSVEDVKNRDKLISLTRFNTNQRNNTSLDEYLENKKKGQKQIFYIAELGRSAEEIAKSVFVEKLEARGYEVLLLSEPLDEIFVQNIRQYQNIPFQDVAKAGLKFGDEDLGPEAENNQEKELTQKFQPLLVWLKSAAKDVVRDVVISNRLLSSPCAVVADTHGYTANIQKLMSSSNPKRDKGIMHEFAMKAKFLEINPRSPLIEGLLRRVEQHPPNGEENDAEALDQLKEITSILIDGALIRSGFEVPDSNGFFTRVDRVLRRSLGVSENAPTDTTVKPAPPQLSAEPSNEKAHVIIPDEMKDKVSIELEELDEQDHGAVHDEL